MKKNFFFVITITVIYFSETLFLNVDLYWLVSLFLKVGDSLAILRGELKSQKKHVKSLKKKSLWSKILEEVTLVLLYVALSRCIRRECAT